MANTEGEAAPIDLASFERLIRVETKLDSVITTKHTDHAELAADIRDHETRIRGLEKAWFKTMGMAAGISALIASGVFAAWVNLLGT